MVRVFVFIFSLIFFISCMAGDIQHDKKFSQLKRVIYITLDGVRTEDFFLHPEYFPIFWNKYANIAKIYGKPNDKNTMVVASVPVSLPSYQSQMAGEVQPCEDNNCGRILVETLPEKLKSQFGFSKKAIAIFASWFEIEYAAQHIADSVFTNTGNMPVYDPDTKIADSVMEALNLQQSMDHYDDDITRYDRYTIDQAMHYFETYMPRFLWISLDDADEAAHGNNRTAYLAALTLYDNFLDQLFIKLKNLHLDEDTTVIVTTDHGRGIGHRWTDHGPETATSKFTWAFVINGELSPRAISNTKINYSTLSIRPTVEAIFQA